MNSGDELIILDVRTKEEYAEAHIPGAILIPNEEIIDTPPVELPDMDAEILIYCRSGNRSAKAAKKLADMGYTNLYDFGGINDWSYETVSGEAVSEETVSKETASEETTDEEAASGEVDVEESISQPKEGTLSSFVASDLDGNKKDESIFKGYKVTMINIWATFCGPCLEEMPELGQLAEEYAEKDVQIVGIVADMWPDKNGSFSQSQIDEAKELVEMTGANYLHLLPSNDLMTAKLNEVDAVPETIFVDENGNVIGQSYLGSRDKEQWSEIIEQMLLEVK